MRVCVLVCACVWLCTVICMLHIQIELGDRMRKVFGKRTFEGTVVSFDICNQTNKKMYHVVYEDRDVEDFYEEQLRPLLYKSSSNGAYHCNEPCTH